MKTRPILLTFFALLITSGFHFAGATEAQETPRHIDVTAKRFAYEPSEITLKKGQPVTVAIRSVDVAHGIHFKELNLQATIDKGGTAKLNFTPAQTGNFVGHCSVFCGSGHGSMTLTFHVVE